MLYRTLLALALASVLSACTSLQDIADNPPFIAAVDVGSIGTRGQPVAWIRSDLEIVVAHASVDLSIALFDKATGLALFEPVRVMEGERFVYSRVRGFSETFELDQPLPAWSRIVFSNGDLGRLLVSFEVEE